MHQGVDHIINNVAGPAVVTGIGFSLGPNFFYIESFTQGVATLASIVGIVWGLINICKALYPIIKKVLPKK